MPFSLMYTQRDESQHHKVLSQLQVALCPQHLPMTSYHSERGPHCQSTTAHGSIIAKDKAVDKTGQMNDF